MRRALLLAAIVAAGGCDLNDRSETPQPAPKKGAAAKRPAGERPVPPPAPDEPGHIGTVVARESVDVPATIEGILAEVSVGIGDHVEAGAPIAVIDDRPIREKLAMARAAVREAEASRRAAAADLAEAKGRYQRREKLSSQVAAEEIESARFDAERARAARSRAAAALSEQRSRVEKLERELTETTITAPFAGNVSIRYVDPGVLVRRGAPVVRLLGSDELWVRFAVPSGEAGAYRVGGRAVVKLEPGGRELEAVVRRIAPDLDPVTQMVVAEAELVLKGDEKHSVQPGAAARVSPGKGPKPGAPD